MPFAIYQTFFWFYFFYFYFCGSVSFFFLLWFCLYIFFEWFEMILLCCKHFLMLFIFFDKTMSWFIEGRGKIKEVQYFKALSYKLKLVPPKLFNQNSNKLCCLVKVCYVNSSETYFYLVIFSNGNLSTNE